MSTSMFERAALFIAALFAMSASWFANAAAPAVGPNVNMVTGTRWPEGDPFLTKQNEPSIAVSSRNPRHLFAAANDYRLVPVEIAEELDDPEAWIQIYKSVDGGASWRSNPLGGCPINIPACNDPISKQTATLKALKPNFGADPTARAGPFGTFFLSFISGTRDTAANGVVAVQRFVDKNDDIQRDTDVRGTIEVPGATPSTQQRIRYAQDPILPDTLTIISQGTPGQFKDKPWVAADVPGRSWNGKKTCDLLSWTKGRTDGVKDASETVPAFNVYVSYANFAGQATSNQHPDAFVAVSTDCGKTFKSTKLSSSAKANQGTSIAIDPVSGTVYVVWRNFDGPQQIMIAKSTDGGNSWSKPVVVAQINPYDQAATGVSFRSLGFPTVAVSVQGTTSRVHVAWAQRGALPSSTPPYYACPSQTNPGLCDARIVMSTSTTGGTTWRTPVFVDSAFKNPLNRDEPGRGHQVQPALSFAAGKLLLTWLDQRNDHTEGKLVKDSADCPSGPGAAVCTPANGQFEYRVAKGNLSSSCSVDINAVGANNQPIFGNLSPEAKAALAGCRGLGMAKASDAVWTTYITDGTPGLVRRHTLDVFAAMADPANDPQFTSTRVSQYAYGNSVGLVSDADGKPVPGPDGKFQVVKNSYDIVQKEVSAPNLPMFGNGRVAFIGDYIDAAGQSIVASGNAANPYKFNVGLGANGPFTTSGLAPAFHVAFTDNRDVIPPKSGDWTTPACLVTSFTRDAQGNVTGVNNPGCGAPGYSGNRNQNVYTSVVSESSLAFANINSKALSSTTPRGFVITVKNLDSVKRTYSLSFQPGSFSATFKKGTTQPSDTVIVQPRSSAAATLWVTGGSNARIVVNVNSTSPDTSYSSQVVLNGDPTAPFVTNGDGPTVPDTANDDLGAVVLSNAVLTNNALSNNVLSNNVLSNNALTNAVLSNVVLSNLSFNVLTNLDPNNVALSNNALSNDSLTNAVLSNVVLSNVVLSNNVLSNNVLSNAALSNVVLSNVALSNTAINAALTNLDPSNVALSNAVLSNNALTNVVLSNLDPTNALSNAVLSNNVLSNAVLSNAALSNVALSNNVLTNNALSNVVLSNAPLGGDTDRSDPNALRSIEVGAPELSNVTFQTQDLANGDFRDITFTVRNRGNTDTTLGFKLLLDAVCDSNNVCTLTTSGGPRTFKLQLVIRKIAFIPVPIPATDAAAGSGNAVRIGLGQTISEISNIGNVPVVDPDQPFADIPYDPNAATIALAPGERAYVTLRAIGVGGSSPPTAEELLRWGVKPIGSDASGTGNPFTITTLSFPPDPIRKALAPATLSVTTIGGSGLIASSTASLNPSSAVCSDKDGNVHLNGIVDPTDADGAFGNFYINTTTEKLFGPKGATAWPRNPDQTLAFVDLIVDRGLATAHASIACPPPATANATPITVADDGSSTRTARLSFTPRYWGDFYSRTTLVDGSAPPQDDRQVQKVTVNPAIAHVTFGSGFPQTLQYRNTFNLRTLVDNGTITSPSFSPITFATHPTANPATDNACEVIGDTLHLTQASSGPGDTPKCVFDVKQIGNETYAPVTDPSPAIYITILKADQVITFPALAGKTYLNPPFTIAASSSSPTAPPSPVAIQFAGTQDVCSVSGATYDSFTGQASATVTILNAGSCTITATQAGDHNYNPALPVAQTFTIDKAQPVVTFGAAPANVTYGDAPVVITGASTNNTAPPDPTPIVFSTASSTCGVTSPTYNSGNGAATVPILHAGQCSITASQAENPNYYSAAAATPLAFTIAKAPQNLAFATTPSNVVYGAAPLVVTATSTSTPAVPSSTAIVFASATTSVCAVSAVQPYSAGQGSVTVTILAAGQCTITADQAEGDDYLLAMQKSISFTVANAPQVLTFGTAPSGVVYGSGPQTVSVSSSSTPAGWSTVPITLGSSAPSVCTVSPAALNAASGTASVTILAAGTCTITADEAATTNYDAAVQATQSFDVAMASSSTGLTASPTSAAAGADVTLTATVTPTPSTAVLTSGTVTFKDGANAIGAAVPLDQNGQATLHVTTLASGQHVITAVYSGDANVTTSTSAAVTVTVVSGEGTFTPTGSMLFERSEHTATKLGDGTVLIVGGFALGGGSGLTKVELYCAAGLSLPTGHPCAGNTGQFILRADIPKPVVRHTATLLPNGRVLVVGGYVGAPTPPADGSRDYIYDPAADSWTPLPGISDNAWYHTATLLASGPHAGKVLIVGGQLPDGSTSNSVALFDPATNTSAVVPGLHQRERHSATLLPDGNVLIAGGRFKNAGQYEFTDTVQVFDATSGQLVAGPFLTAHHFWHQAAALSDGRVILAGGACDSNAGTVNGHVEAVVETAGAGIPPTIVDCPVPADPLDLGQARMRFTLTPFADGWALALGGSLANGSSLATAEFFDPDYDNGAGNPKGNFAGLTATMSVPRSGHAATLLNDGRVLVTGGFDGTAITKTAELFTESP